MAYRKEVNCNVVLAAELRVVKAFEASQYVVLSFSGGKDSICTIDVTIRAMKKHNIPFSRLIVVFFDEEAIYPDIERITLKWRKIILSLGAKFYWFCLPFKHYNCCNRLANDETFICWDPSKNDVWVRQMPEFAIRFHKGFKPGMSYQEFSKATMYNMGSIQGLRIDESLMRRKSISELKSPLRSYPIYDWKETDVWKYIKERNLEFPETYIYLYKCGVSLSRLRISQFFSIDTITSLPKVLEFYPDLYQRIIRREPNADLAILYVGTDMFRSSKHNQLFGVQKDYKQALEEEWKRACKYPGEYMSYKDAAALMSKLEPYHSEAIYKRIYEILIAGDPKHRTYRAVVNRMYEERLKWEKKHAKETQ